MGIDQLSINLDNQPLTYVPGQMVSGHVVILASGEEKTKGIELTFSGKVKVYFTRTHTVYHGTGKDRKSHWITRHHRAEDTIFTYPRYLLGNGSEAVLIPSGESRYAFTFQLPLHNIPSSFEGEYGKVEYSLKATVKRPWYKFDPEFKKIITVTDVQDLNHDPVAANPGEWTNSKGFCWPFSSGFLEMKVTTSKRGYCPGESMEVNVEINNTSARKVNDLSLELFQKVAFHAQGLTNHTSHSLVCHKRGQGVANGERGSWRVEIKVPQVPSMRLGCCRLIDLQYSLEVVAITSAFSFNLETTCPIIIGNVPVNSV